MRDNSRVRERFELALDARQVVIVVVGTLVILGGVFVLGMNAGRQAGPPAPVAAIAAPKDSLAKLDEPLAVDPPPELKAHQALTDGRAIEKAMPVAAMKPPEGSASAGLTPPPVVAPPPVAAAVTAASLASKAGAPGASAQRPISAPPRAAEPGVAPVKKGGFTIQVAASPRRADAERLARQLSARSPRIVTADVPGKGRWYRVQIGAFDTREAARRQLASLLHQGVQGIVTASR